MNKKEMKKRIFKSVVENHSDIEQEDLEKFYAKWIKEYPENLILDVMGEYFFLDPLSYPSSDDEMGYTTIYSDLEDYFSDTTVYVIKINNLSKLVNLRNNLFAHNYEQISKQFDLEEVVNKEQLEKGIIIKEQYIDNEIYWEEITKKEAIEYLN